MAPNRRDRGFDIDFLQKIMILIFMIESFLTFLKMLFSKRNNDEFAVTQTSPKGFGGD